MNNTTSLRDMANAISALSMDAVEKANSGHPGMPMGMADVATVLFTEFLKYNPKEPNWGDRDRFVLSAGHGSMLLYSLLYLTGYEDMTIDEIKNFRQLGAKTAGHPEFGHATGIETTTGPLGQGLANAVGMALAERIMSARFGSDLVDHYTYTIAGDGCLMEGISQEAISFAGHQKLSKLVVLFDDNKISIDGPTSLSTSEDQLARFKACNWHVQSIDGHDYEAIHQAIEAAKSSDAPSLIACRTTIAKGAPTKAGTSASHGAPLGSEEIAGARKALGWEHEPFVIPESVLGAWRDAGAKGEQAYEAWQKAHEASSNKEAFDVAINLENVDKIDQLTAKLKESLASEKPKLASRKASGNVLEVLNAEIPELIGGSADLTGSNNTKTKESKPITAEDASGDYIYYGIREHGMAAIMNGMALHGGMVPYSGTFLVFTDYCRPSIRLSALMKQQVVYVMTHDSIGLGEDGPTHQPVEHLAALRAIPDLLVIRPADATETAEAWQTALKHKHCPSVLVLTRQGLPALRTDYVAENLSAKGGYIISKSEKPAQAVIVASGSEVHLAVEAQSQLAEQGIYVQVVSMPCMELYEDQAESYKKIVMPDGLPVIAVEAAISQSWEKYTGKDGTFIGMSSFGASAPAADLFEHFGITSTAIVEAVNSTLGARKVA